MKYKRLKTLESTGTPILRYYKLAAGEQALANTFYEIKDNVASRVVGTPTGKLIGFSHGGNALAKGLIFLDINHFVVYMGILEEGDTKPNIGDVVNGYQKVIDTHYEAESANGKNADGFGIEYLDVPYYLFVIEQPTDGTAVSIDDSDSGEVTPQPDPKVTTITTLENGDATYTVTVVATPKAPYADAETYTLAPGAQADLTFGPDAGEPLSTVYSSIVGTYNDTDETTVNVDLTTIIGAKAGNLYTFEIPE